MNVIVKTDAGSVASFPNCRFRIDAGWLVITNDHGEDIAAFPSESVGFVDRGSEFTVVSHPEDNANRDDKELEASSQP